MQIEIFLDGSKRKIGGLAQEEDTTSNSSFSPLLNLTKDGDTASLSSEPLPQERKCVQGLRTPKKYNSGSKNKHQ